MDRAPDTWALAVAVAAVVAATVRYGVLRQSVAPIALDEHEPGGVGRHYER